MVYAAKTFIQDARAYDKNGEKVTRTPEFADSPAYGSGSAPKIVQKWLRNLDLNEMLWMRK